LRKYGIYSNLKKSEADPNKIGYNTFYKEKRILATSSSNTKRQNTPMKGWERMKEAQLKAMSLRQS